MKRKLTFISVIAVLLFVFSASASALLFDLTYEFDGLLPVQSYGTVEVTQNGDDLDFEIIADTSTLGATADIHKFYFNLNRWKIFKIQIEINNLNLNLPVLLVY